MKVFDVKTMRYLDKMTIETDGIQGKILMERAGNGAGEIILEYTEKLDPSFVRRFVIFCGSGNNGGDGFVISRYLSAHSNCKIIVFCVEKIDELKSSDAAFHAALLPESVQVDDVENYQWKPGDIVIDCLLGTGFKGELRSPYNSIIEKINRFSHHTISVDIPSGLNGNDGSAAAGPVKASMTINIAFPKIGIFRNDGPSVCGLLKNVDIGIVDRGMESLLDTLFIDDVRQMMPSFHLDTHKNRRGSVTVIGGSSHYGGAPFLSGESALRAGAGLCRVVTANGRVTNHKQALIVNAIGNNFTAKDFDGIVGDIESGDSIVLGPGLGSDVETAGFVARMLSVDKKMVIDADALNFISTNRQIWQNKNVRVLTPHPGEMRRLLNGFDLEQYSSEARHIQAVKLAEVTGTIVVLKGFQTVIAMPDGRFRINTSGCSNLATAGSGDCLTGVIGAFLNHFEDVYDAVSCAVFVHGLAGELSDYACGTIADDLPELIAKACKMVRN